LGERQYAQHGIARFVHRILWLALAALVLSPLASAGRPPVPNNGFEISEQTLFLTGTTGDVGARTGVYLLSNTTPANNGPTDGRYQFLLPGVSVLGVINQKGSESWYDMTPAPKDLEITSDTSATLYFSANAQATTIFSVNLYDMDAAGQVALMGTNTQQFITALSPTPIDFHLATAGFVLRQGHYLQLEIQPQTLTVAVLMNYGGNTPSALTALPTRYLDTDADGVSDSDEGLSGTNALDPTDQNSGNGPDADGDGLSDSFEHAIGTDAHDNDTDNDHYGDGIEVHAGTNPLDPNSFPYDANNDGIPDSFVNYYFTNTTVGQGLGDPTADPDDDGCNNLCEAAHGTDPNNPDTDGDGVSDGDEIKGGTNPAGFSFAAAAGIHPVPEVVAAGAFFAVGNLVVLLSLLRRP
jgi:hypothetical protein